MKDLKSYTVKVIVRNKIKKEKIKLFIKDSSRSRPGTKNLIYLETRIKNTLSVSKLF